MPTIVVLGGAFAGLEVAHKLLKHTLPAVKDLKVILVSQNSHFYWNLASVRAIVPGQLKEEDYCLPIADGFDKYPTEEFEFIIGTAETLDTDAKSVKVALGGAGGERTLTYDHVVLATGSRCAVGEVPWKSASSHEETMERMTRTQERVKAAKHIVVAGAGTTGVEAAGELGYEFKDKKIVLLSGDDTLLSGDSLSSNATTELKKLGVEICLNSRVASASETEDGSQTEVVLQNGDQIVTDLYLPTMGVTPNSEYVPSKLLTDKKFVDIDDCYRAKEAPNVWAAGDIVWKPKGSFVLADMQAAGVAKNIDLVLKGKEPTKISTIPFDVAMASVGRERGIGRMGFVKCFSLMIYHIKVKTLGTQRLAGWVSGSNF